MLVIAEALEVMFAYRYRGVVTWVCRFVTTSATAFAPVYPVKADINVVDIADNIRERADSLRDRICIAEGERGQNSTAIAEAEVR